MPADYNIPMTDAQITEALQLMVERVSEGWAQETYDGSPVGSGSPYYHKSSKYWATRSEDAAARAEAAVPAGTAGAVFFDRAQTLTTAQQEQARQNIKAGGSNRNLLDNPWFTVNQRGQTTVTNSGTAIYFVDRWKIGRAEVIVESNSIKYKWLNTGTAAFLIQYTGIDAFNALKGKTVTLSASINGTVYSTAFTAPTDASGNISNYALGQGVRFNFAIDLNGRGYELQIHHTVSNDYITIASVKLELGSVSTLANDAPPNYAEELAKCQRYFIKLDGSPTMAGVYTTTNTKFAASFPLPVTMRATPTLTGSGSYTIRSTAGDLVASAISVDGITPNAVKLLFTTSAATARLAGMALINGYIDLSAEL